MVLIAHLSLKFINSKLDSKVDILSWHQQMLSWQQRSRSAILYLCKLLGTSILIKSHALYRCTNYKQNWTCFAVYLEYFWLYYSNLYFNFFLLNWTRPYKTRNYFSNQGVVSAHRKTLNFVSKKPRKQKRHTAVQMWEEITEWMTRKKWTDYQRADILLHVWQISTQFIL